MSAGPGLPLLGSGVRGAGCESGTPKGLRVRLLSSLGTLAVVGVFCDRSVFRMNCLSLF